MKKLIVAFCLVFTVLFSEQTHHFKLGPNVSFYKYNEEITPTEVKKEYGYLEGFMATYEYLKPHSIYVGGLINSSQGTTSFKKSSNVLGKTSNSFKNIAAQIGYNFPLSTALITPYVGVGYHIWSRLDTSKAIEGEGYQWSFFSSGIKANCPITEQIYVGLKAEAVFLYDAQMYVDARLPNPHIQIYSRRPHYQLELPIAFYSKSKTSYLSFSPFWSKEQIDVMKTQLFMPNQPLSRESENLGIRMEVHFDF